MIIGISYYMSIIQTLFDYYITCHKFIKSLYPFTRDILEYYGVCKKPNQWKQIHYNEKIMITYEEYINDIKYIKIVDIIHKQIENKIIPFEKKPFMYIQLVFNDTHQNIYDDIKPYFVNGNIINRELVEYIALHKYNMNLCQNEAYQIHVFTNDATLKIYTERDLFEYK